MIVCQCTGATDRDFRRGLGGRGRRLTGTCGGCAPLVRELRRALPWCASCGNRPEAQYLGEPVCLTCAAWADAYVTGGHCILELLRVDILGDSVGALEPHVRDDVLRRVLQ